MPRDPPAVATFHLRHTFRCPPTICAVANALLRHTKGEGLELEAASLSPEGTVWRRGGLHRALEGAEDFTLIARTNAGLVLAEVSVFVFGGPPSAPEISCAIWRLCCAVFRPPEPSPAV